jgi:hypothetical protein
MHGNRFTLLIAVVAILAASAVAYAQSMGLGMGVPDLPVLGAEGSVPSWVPTASGIPATLYANYAGDQFWYNGTTWDSGNTINDFSAWLTALGGTFSRSTTGTYTNSQGLLATASSNVPRFDYNPSTLAANGVLLEGASTNLALQSNSFVSSPWSLSTVNASVTANSAASPDGTTNATLFSLSGTSGELYQSLTNAATTITRSLFVKQSTSNNNYVYLQFVNNEGGGNAVRQFFNINTGAVASHATFGSGFTFVSASIFAYPNGWFRCTLTASVPSNATIVFSTSSTDSPATQAAGQGAYIYGEDDEALSFASSYIPTTSSTATRGADSLTATPTGGIIPASSPGITVQADFSYEGLLSYNQPWQIGNTGQTQYVSIYNPSTGAATFQAISSAGSVSTVSGTFAANTSYKTAMAVSAGSLRSYVNGSAAANDTSASVGLPSTFAEMWLGQGSDAYSLQGDLSRFGAWPLAASNSDLQRLSSQ